MKKIIALLVGLAVAAPCFFAAEEAAAPMAGTHEHFNFSRAEKNIIVWYFVPPGADAQTPVVFVMHGLKRNGEDYLKDWIPLAQERRFVLAVPEFSLKDFPGDTGYIYGNTVDTAGHSLPRAQWSFSLIEPIFDALKSKTGNQSARYSLYGHSAGAQFVQRFVYFIPEARANRVVSANAGWYLLPDFSASFPYGFKNTPVTEADLRHALQLPLVILLGEADTNPNDKVLRHTPEADAQGNFRLARGKFFFARAQEAAQTRGLTLAWQLGTVPGVGHSDPKMAPAAIHWLFP